jgi:hypothetical protein
MFFRNGKNMKTAITIVTILVLWAYPLYSAADDSLVPPPVPAEEQPEVLTSGPVHEAFAEPVNIQVQQGLVAPKAPPANIVENTPAQRPEGDQFVLVPGYWAWDVDRSDYIWVSACWRAAPPNTYWVPGYWAKVDEGWEWVAGFWAQSGSQSIEYLPAPPALADVEAVGSAPSEDNVWVPPCQYWSNGNYVVRHGYWLEAREGWVWTPSHYIWTPRGYVFSPGHWDYSLERRGVLFAPVYFSHGFHFRAGFSFSPSIVISLGLLQVNLFTCPRYSHFYFGDYYDDSFIRIGIFPRFECEGSGIWYDPIFVYDRWHNRHSEPHWGDHERHEYDLRRNDKDLRPPRTYHEMETREAGMSAEQRKNFHVAHPLTEKTASAATMRFQQINPKTRQKINTQATEVHKLSDKRSQWESASTTEKTTQPSKGSKGLLGHKETVSQPVERNGSVTQSSEHKESVTAPAEHKGSVTPPTEHKETVVTQPSEHKETVAQPAEHKESVTAPAEHKVSAAKPAENAPAFVPPRKVRATGSEKVTIPKSPVVGKFVSSDKSNAGPPSRPVEERKQVDDSRNKDNGRDNTDRNKDSGRDNKDKGK